MSSSDLPNSREMVAIEKDASNIRHIFFWQPQTIFGAIKRSIIVFVLFFLIDAIIVRFLLKKSMIEVLLFQYIPYVDFQPFFSLFEIYRVLFFLIVLICIFLLSTFLLSLLPLPFLRVCVCDLDRGIFDCIVDIPITRNELGKQFCGEYEITFYGECVKSEFTYTLNGQRSVACEDIIYDHQQKRILLVLCDFYTLNDYQLLMLRDMKKRFKKEYKELVEQNLILLNFMGEEIASAAHAHEIKIRESIDPKKTFRPYYTEQMRQKEELYRRQVESHNEGENNA